MEIIAIYIHTGQCVVIGEGHTEAIQKENNTKQQ